MLVIQIYTGNGKGKSTAAFGLAMRARGHGQRVRVIQFLKGSTYTGELSSADKLGIEVFQFGRTCPHAAVIKSGFMKCQKCRQCWIKLDDINEMDIEKTKMAWKLTLDTIANAQHDILILDEIINALNKDLISSAELINNLKKASSEMEIIMTGRNAPAEIIKIADLVSEIKEIKHPVRQGVEARRGIEY